MAFRASNQIPADQYDKAKQIANQVKNLAQNRSSAFSGGANATAVLSVADNMRELRSRLLAIASTPGIVTYAQNQEDDDTYDVSAEFTAMTDAMQAVIDEIVTTVPKDANGWLLINKIEADGTLSPRQFTGSQLSGLRTQLDNVAASVT